MHILMAYPTWRYTEYLPFAFLFVGALGLAFAAWRSSRRS